MKKWVKNLENIKFTKSEYSQYFQQDLIDYVFENIELDDNSKFCVEFGYSEDQISEYANTTGLIKNKSWDYFFLDAVFENHDINLYKEFLTTENIIEIFRKYKVPKNLGYISIDVDSTDLWLFKELLTHYKPQLYSVEYNPQFPIDSAITTSNNPKLKFNNDCAYGASLKALNMVAMENGYSLLWVVPTLDTFFIRNDLIDDGSDFISFPIEKFKNATNLPNHPRLIDRNNERVSNFLDYEVFLNSNFDLNKSVKSAEKIVLKYLVGLGNFRTKFYRIRLYIRKYLNKAKASQKISNNPFFNFLINKVSSKVDYFYY